MASTVSDQNWTVAMESLESVPECASTHAHYKLSGVLQNLCTNDLNSLAEPDSHRSAFRARAWLRETNACTAHAVSQVRVRVWLAKLQLKYSYQFLYRLTHVTRYPNLIPSSRMHRSRIHLSNRPTFLISNDLASVNL